MSPAAELDYSMFRDWYAYSKERFSYGCDMIAVAHTSSHSHTPVKRKEYSAPRWMID